MNWKTIMKESRKDKDRIYEDSEGFDERRTKLVGGSDKDKFGRIQDNEETHLDEGGDNQMSELSELTRQDLKEKVLEMIDGFSKEQLLELLESSLGDIKVHNIEYDDNRSA